MIKSINEAAKSAKSNFYKPDINKFKDYWDYKNFEIKMKNKNKHWLYSFRKSIKKICVLLNVKDLNIKNSRNYNNTFYIITDNGVHRFSDHYCVQLSDDCKSNNVNDNGNFNEIKYI